MLRRRRRDDRGQIRVQRDIERRSVFFLPDADHLSRDAVLADMPPDVLASHADYVATSLAGIEQQCSLPILANASSIFCFGRSPAFQTKLPVR